MSRPEKLPSLGSQEYISPQPTGWKALRKSVRESSASENKRKRGGKKKKGEGAR